jgi:putative DNA-invertase from lambdoid prophage Rac
VSTLDQNLESQTNSLLEWCHRNSITNYEIFADHGISGAKDSRPSLNRMMAMAEKGDLEKVVVFHFSRFARSTTHLLKALEKFKSKQIAFVSICESIGTNSAMGVLLLTILGALAQLEKELIRERVISEMKNAKAKGVKIGRVRKRNDVLIHSLLEAGLSFRDVARIVKCSHGSVSASKKEFLAKKAELEKKKIEELSRAAAESNVNTTTEQMKALNIPDDMAQKVQAKLENDARENVREIQGIAYDTYD